MATVGREIVLDIRIPQSVLTAEGPVLSEDNIGESPIVRREVKKVVRALKLGGVLQRGDNIIAANLQVDPSLTLQSPERPVNVTQIFREDPNGTGSIDSHTDRYFARVKPQRKS